MRRLLRAAVWILLLVCVASAAGAERLDDETLYSFYDDSVFFGDSITRALTNHVTDLRQKGEQVLPNTLFYSTGSITLNDGSRPTVVGTSRCFNYRGMDVTMYFITISVKAKKAFIMLGMNDPVGLRIDLALERIEDIMYYMRRDTRTADVEVYFFSVTPVGARYCEERNRPEYQDSLDEYNRQLKEKCAELGAGYIEVAEALKGEDNLLDPAYSSDRGMFHLNADGLDVWLTCLRDYAQEQYDLGLWDPIRKSEDYNTDYNTVDHTPAMSTDLTTQ